MLRPVVPVLLLALGILSAGCVSLLDPSAASDGLNAATSGNGTDATDQPGADNDDDAAAAGAGGNGTGALRILVQTPHLQPIEGANVEVANLTGQTDADGLVRLAGVPTGLQTLVASKDGYRSARLGVDVPAGGEAYAEAKLGRDPTLPNAPPEERHDEVYEFEGYFDCSATYLIITGDCLAVLTNASERAGAPADAGESTNERNAFEFPLDLGWKSVVLELFWTSTTTSVDGGMSLALEPAAAPATGETVRYARVESPEAPVRLQLDAGMKHESATAEDMPNPLGGEVLRARAFLLGAADNPGGTPFLGAGATLGHRFTLYATVFYDGAAPTDYTIRQESA